MSKRTGTTLLLALTLLSLPLRAAGLRTIRPEIPLAFEINRGQSPSEFRYVLVHHNAGFACDGFYSRSSTFPSRQSNKLTFVGANPNCASNITGALPSVSHFYRGMAKSASQENVRHYSTIEFHNVWPGVDVRYSSVSSGYTMTIQAASAAAVAQIRLSPASSRYEPASMATTVYSPAGTFLLSGAVRAVTDLESNQVSFITSAPGPVTITMTPTPGNLNVVEPQARRLAVDPEGAVYFAANTTTYSQLDSTSASCLSAAFIDACPDVYIAKFDRTGTLQYLVYLQGDRYDSAYQIESDLGGNIYIAGTTLSYDFPTTAGAYQERYQGPAGMTMEYRSYVGGDAFVAKLHGPTGGLIYSTLIGGSGEDSAMTMRVDRIGRTYLGLDTRSQDLPRKGPQVESSPACTQFALGAGTTCFWLLSLDEHGRELRYAQQTSSQAFELSPSGTLFYQIATPKPPDGNELFLTQNALWFDGSLRYSVPLGTEWSVGILGPDESLWSIRWIQDEPLAPPKRSQLSRLRPDGEGPQVVKADLDPNLQLFGVDENNNLWVTGNIQVTSDAPLKACPGCPRAGILDASGTQVFGTALLPNTNEFRLANGLLYAISTYAQPSITVMDRSALPQPILASITDANPRGFTLTPGNVLALTGALIGPDRQVYHPTGESGRLATEVDGFRVLFNNQPALIVSAERDRLVVQVPPTQETPWTDLTIEQQRKPLLKQPLMAAFARGPIILAGPNPADDSFVIRNEDGTVNSPENPANLGTVVSFLVAGVGQTNPPQVPGQLRHDVLATPVTTPDVSFSLGTPNAEVLSYQQAQNQPSGIMQMRVRLPQTAAGSDPSVNWWALFFVQGTPSLPATSQDPLRIYIRR